MQAVILAAGSSTRTYPLTLTRPKPLLKVGTKTLIGYNLDQLKGLVTEVIIIVGYKKDMIRSFLGESYSSIKIRYIEQKKQLGTGHALMQARDMIKGKFIVMMGDDLYTSSDIRKCLQHDLCVLAQKVDDPSRFGVFVVEGGKVKNLVEKPKRFVSELANTGLYVFDKRIFSYLENIKKSKRGELELTDAVKAMAQKEDVFLAEAENWVSVGYAWDLFKVKDLFNIRDNAFGKDCEVYGIVRNSIIMDNTIIKDGSFIEDSIIGENCTIKAKIRSAEKVQVNIQGKAVNTNKLGAIIGDNCMIEDSVIVSGSLIEPNKKMIKSK